MASTHLFRPPASRLNDDTLYHIFFLNTIRSLCISEEYPEHELMENMPSTVTRRSSQVCKQWRHVLLRASFIWGRCIDLDALGTSTEWRDEVYRRSGKAPLVIRHQSRSFKYYVGDEYLEQLLAEAWPRVMELDIPYHGPHFRLIMPLLEFPAPCMESFLIRGSDDTSPDEDIEIYLFEGYAPKLVNIMIPSGYITYDAVSMWKSPTFFTVNMRQIHLDNESNITPSVLMEACMRMPLLEYLSVSLWPEDDYPPPEFSPDQEVVLAMNHLTTIYIRCPTFDVYQDFLSRISTAPGCSLTLTHWVKSEVDTLVRYAEVMKQMFAKFSESLYDNYPRTTGSNEARLKVLISGPIFAAYDQRIFIEVGEDPGADERRGADPLYIPAAIDAFLAVKMPSNDINLELEFFPDIDQRQWISDLPRETRTQLEISMQRLLGPDSMPWATSLRIQTNGLYLIHKLYQAHTVFPRLQHLIVNGSGPMHMNTVILPFVANRRKTMMTVNIDSLSESPARYVRALGRDRLPEGLVIIWNESERFSLAEYVEEDHPEDENEEPESSSSASSD